MAAPTSPEPAKLFAAILWTGDAELETALRRLAETFGPIDFQSADHPFDLTDYYDQEMGGRPQRRLVAFRDLAPPESIRQAKLTCNAIEDELAQGRGRRVNLDIGYLDHNKIVLASAKAAGQKIHLGDGIYADLVARFARGKYQPFEWTFPDFSDGRYDAELAEMRRLHLEQLRSWRQRHG